jgi:hypothetical protein
VQAIPTAKYVIGQGETSKQSMCSHVHDQCCLECGTHSMFVASQAPNSTRWTGAWVSASTTWCQGSPADEQWDRRPRMKLEC